MQQNRHFVANRMCSLEEFLLSKTATGNWLPSEQGPKFRVIHLGIVTPVDRDFSKHFHRIDPRPCDFACEAPQSVGVCLAIQLDGKKPIPLVRNDGRAANAGHLLSGALDCERKKDTALVFDSRVAAAQKPETATFIEIARISRAVPPHAIDIELSL